jgi:hypothetical protein
MADNFKCNGDGKQALPSLSIEPPDAEPSDEAINALAALLIDSALKTEDHNESKSRTP